MNDNSIEIPLRLAENTYCVHEIDEYYAVGNTVSVIGEVSSPVVTEALRHHRTLTAICRVILLPHRSCCESMF